MYYVKNFEAFLEAVAHIPYHTAWWDPILKLEDHLNKEIKLWLYDTRNIVGLYIESKNKKNSRDVVVLENTVVNGGWSL